MKLTIFYAWQSDTDRDLNQRFIRRAADAAIAKLRAEIVVEDAPEVSIELDHDTKGVTGTPHIAETIKAKIRGAAIFLADVTHVGRYETKDGREKRCQNPNVLIELGLALAAKGPDRIVLVQNTAFGPPDDLPFDLRHHRFPIAYALKESKGVSAEKEFKSLVATLAKAFKPFIEAEHARERAEAALAAEAVSKTRKAEVVTLRESFDRDVAAGRVNGFNLHEFRGDLTPKMAPPTITACIFPVTPPDNAIDLDDRYAAISSALRPLFVAEHDTEVFGRCIISHKTRVIPLGIDDLNVGFTDALVKMTDDGCIFAAEELLPRGVDHSFLKPARIEMYEVERQLLMRLRDYVQMMHLACRVSPPLLLSLSILQPAGILLCAPKMPGLRRLGEDVHADAVLLPAGFDPANASETIVAIASALRPSLNLIWRSAGLRADPFIDDVGRFRS